MSSHEELQAAQEAHDLPKVNRFREDNHKGPETIEVAARRDGYYWAAVEHLYEKEAAIRAARTGVKSG